MIFVCFFLTIYADYPIYNFDKKNLNISDLNFRRYIRPQLNWIVNDFEKLFFEVNILKENNLALSIFKNIIALNECNGCKDIRRKIDSDFRKMEVQLVSSDTINTNNYDQVLAIDKLTNELYNNYLQSNTSENFNYSALLALSSSLILTSMPKKYQEHYQSLWHNFILPLWTKAIHQENYLIDSLGDFNMAWNSFNRKIMRGVITISNTGFSLSDRIHYRWNTILKVYLRKS